MYKPSRLTASILLVVQLCSLDLYATNGNATAQKVQQQEKSRIDDVNVASDGLADALEHKDFVSAKGHKVRFWQDGASQWQASVTLAESGEDLTLRVEGKDEALARLAQADLDQQKRMLRVMQSEDEESSMVYMGSLDVEVFNPEANGSDVALMGENVTEGVLTLYKDMQRAMNGPEFRQALANQKFREFVKKVLESVGVDEELTDKELDAWVMDAQERVQLALSKPGFDQKVKELVESKAFQQQLESTRAEMCLAITAPPMSQEVVAGVMPELKSKVLANVGSLLRKFLTNLQARPKAFLAFLLASNHEIAVAEEFELFNTALQPTLELRSKISEFDIISFVPLETFIVIGIISIFASTCGILASIFEDLGSGSSDFDCIKPGFVITSFLLSTASLGAEAHGISSQENWEQVTSFICAFIAVFISAISVTKQYCEGKCTHVNSRQLAFSSGVIAVASLAFFIAEMMVGERQTTTKEQIVSACTAAGACLTAGTAVVQECRAERSFGDPSPRSIELKVRSPDDI